VWKHGFVDSTQKPDRTERPTIDERRFGRHFCNSQKLERLEFSHSLGQERTFATPFGTFQKPVENRHLKSGMPMVFTHFWATIAKN
jgi:hypothetical protein